MPPVRHFLSKSVMLGGLMGLLIVLGIFAVVFKISKDESEKSARLSAELDKKIIESLSIPKTQESVALDQEIVVVKSMSVATKPRDKSPEARSKEQSIIDSLTAPY